MRSTLNCSTVLAIVSAGIAFGQAVTTASASTNCVHFSGTTAQGIPIPPTFYTVNGTDSAVCADGDTGSSAGTYAEGLSVSAYGFGLAYVSGGATAETTSTLNSTILYPFDGVAHITVTITQRGVDDGGSNQESASFSVGGVLMASMSDSFSIPPSHQSQTWTFDVPFMSGVAIPYSGQVGVNITAAYGTVQCSSSMNIDIEFTPAEDVLTTFFLAG